MKEKIPLIARILLGLAFFGAGLAGLLTKPPPMDGMPEGLIKFTEGLSASIYFMPFLKVTEAVCGLMLLTGFFVPLALVVLAPITLNIFLVHLFLEPKGVPLAVIIGVLMIYLSFFAPPYAPTIKQLFRKK